jgi:3-oxoacyl-[acyl-carrier protein] reductase
MTSLSGKLALVTGAAGVLGQAIAKALAREGMRVVAVNLQDTGLATLAEELGAGAAPLELDISDANSVGEAVARIRHQHGEVDVLINNAGVLSNNKAAETTPEEWRRLMSVNLDGAFYLCREVLPAMKAKGWGRIVNVCSLAMKTGGLTAGTAYITVNGVAPAYIKTPMVTEQLSEAQRQRLLAELPLGRFCEAEEVAHVVAFLVSPLSGFITGEIIDINGGLHMD